MQLHQLGASIEPRGYAMHCANKRAWAATGHA
jgi:hypothetical protein